MRYVAALLLLLGPLLPSSAASSAPATGAPAARPGLVEALAVLHAWDERRARAWAGSDVGALRELYVPGAAAGSADVRLLEAYRARGVVVRRLVTQVFAAVVVRRDGSTWVLRVSDRVAGGEVVRHGRAAPLGSSPPALRTVVLRRSAAGWQVAAVSGSARVPRAARR